MLWGTISCSLRYRQAVSSDPYFWSGIVRGLSLDSTTTANRLAGSLSLAFSLILWCGSFPRASSVRFPDIAQPSCWLIHANPLISQPARESRLNPDKKRELHVRREAAAAEASLCSEAAAVR